MEFTKNNIKRFAKEISDILHGNEEANFLSCTFGSDAANQDPDFSRVMEKYEVGVEDIEKIANIAEGYSIKWFANYPTFKKRESGVTVTWNNPWFQIAEDIRSMEYYMPE